MEMILRVVEGQVEMEQMEVEEVTTLVLVEPEQLLLLLVGRYMRATVVALEILERLKTMGVVVVVVREELVKQLLILLVVAVQMVSKSILMVTITIGLLVAEV
jgi:hypothetical protein